MQNIAITNTNLQFESICYKGQQLFGVKNKQYGDAFRLYGLLGVTCELLGAVQRLPQLVLWSLDHGRSSTDIVKDILIDIHNYAVMGLMVIEDGNIDGRKQKNDV